MLRYMALFDMDPLMFHQSNLYAYDGTHFLLGELLDATIQKYASYMNLPVLSPTMDKLGERMKQRMTYNGAGLEATWTPGVGLTLTAQKSCVVAISGVKYGASGAIDTFTAGTYRNYGNQFTSYVQVNAGQSVSVPFTGGDLSNVTLP